MEFLLINHPARLPDLRPGRRVHAAGQLLRLRPAALAATTSRSGSTRPSTATTIGPHVIADMTRCIQCTRCIRFCQEIAGTAELTFLDRGGRTLVWTHEGGPLANEWSGLRRGRLPRRRADGAGIPLPQPRLVPAEDAVDLPRLQHRLQHLDRVASDNVVYRFLPRLNPDVNDYWLCDHGRFLSESLNLRDVAKATFARRRRGEATCTVPAAVERIAAEIRGAIDSKGAAVRLLPRLRPPLERRELPPPQARRPPRLSPTATSPWIAAKPRRIKSQKGWITGEEAAANFRGARELGLTPGTRRLRARGRPLRQERRRTSWSWRTRDSRAAADDAAAVAAMRRAQFLAVAARTSNALTRAADVVLPAASLAEKEGTFTNVQGRVAEVRARVPVEAARARALGPPAPARQRARLRGSPTGRRRISAPRSRRRCPATATAGVGARRRRAPEEGRLRLEGRAVTFLDWVILVAARGAAGADPARRS